MKERGRRAVTRQSSWRAAAAYEWREGLTTKLIVGRAFQIPSAVLLYTLPHFGNENQIVGNRTRPTEPELQPQVVESAELVAAATVLQHVIVEGAFYAQRVDDKIEFLQVATQWLPRNLGRQGSVGFELALRVAGEYASGYVTGTAQRVLLEDEFTRELEMIEGPAPQYPNVMATAGLSARAPALHLSGNLHLRYVGARAASQSNILRNNEKAYELPAYATVDVTIQSAGWYLLGDGAETQARLHVRNLLDNHYSEPGFGGFDIPSLGRMIMLELHQSF